MKKELSSTQYRALVALSTGRTNDEVAVMCKVTLRTIMNWRAREDFAQLMRDANHKIFEEALCEAILYSKKAVQELCRIIDDSDVPSRVKISAISTLLKAGETKFALDVEEDIRRLEGKFDELKNARNLLSSGEEENIEETEETEEIDYEV